jgi:hypothetical protein
MVDSQPEPYEPPKIEAREAIVGTRGRTHVSEDEIGYQIVKQIGHQIVKQWTTIAVTALPIGWCNFFSDASDGKELSEPCPAILLQEERSYVHRWNEVRGDGTVVSRESEHLHDPPFATRVVYASDENGSLESVFDFNNYLRTEWAPSS